MPIYDFHCKHCDRTFEQRIERARRSGSCPRCGRRTAKRLPSRVQLRTSGPYAPTFPASGPACEPTG
jgi:putative FmdB family regulatory protein